MPDSTGEKKQTEGRSRSSRIQINRRKVPKMAIEVRLDLMLVKRKMSLTELSDRIEISVTNLSLLKTGKVKGIRFKTLESICRELECQPGEILEYMPDYV
jgi:putative transcriptional regulator